jgi:hypothetical protein
MTALTKPISLDVNTLDVDGDGQKDHVTFHVTQTGEQEFSVRTFVDVAKDGFGTLSSDKTKILNIDTKPGWQLSSVKYENHKLTLLGKDGTPESIDLNDVLTVTGKSMDKVAMQKQLLDKEIQENAGVLSSLRDDSALDSALGATGLNADDMNGIGGLIGTRGTQIGSGGLGGRGSGLGGGSTAEGLGGLGTKGRGSGASGYGSGGLGSITSEPIILGAMDKSLIDAVIKRNMTQIRYCYQRELTKQPDLSGKMTIKFVIAKDGTVSSATVKTGTDETGREHTSWNHADIGQKVGDAICARFLRFQFPEPKGGGIVITSYPFIFSPG